METAVTQCTRATVADKMHARPEQSQQSMQAVTVASQGARVSEHMPDVANMDPTSVLYALVSLSLSL